jgi:hypothetical protein
MIKDILITAKILPKMQNGRARKGWRELARTLNILII